MTDSNTATVPVYEWAERDGTVIGCGTRREFDHWQDQGVVPKGAILARVLTHEPASEDDRRVAAWAA